MTDARRLVDKPWSCCNVLRDDGVGTIEYTEQLTYLPFLKMAHERSTRKLNPQQIVPAEYDWQTLLDADADGDALEVQYRHDLDAFSRQPGLLGTILRKAQNRNQDSARLKRLSVDTLPAPEVVAREIVEDLTAALAELEAVATALETTALEGSGGEIT